MQGLAENLGIRGLNERLSDPTMQADFESIIQRDNPKNTQFSINFFSGIGLGGITDNLRDNWKKMPHLIMLKRSSDHSNSRSETSSSEESESGDRRNK